MSHHPSWMDNRSRVENEMWFNMPATRRQSLEQTAYQSTSRHYSVASRRSTSNNQSEIPIISTANVDKPLPPSPTSSERKRKSNALRIMFHRRNSNHLNPTPLQTEGPAQPSSATGSLNVNTQSQHNHTYSRSMPNSPYDHWTVPPISACSPGIYLPLATPRVVMTRVQPSSTQPNTQVHTQLGTGVRQQRATSMNTYFEPLPPRAHTFPETAAPNPTAREGVSSRPRPHTWLSPTDSFTDASQYSLFAQATTGLPDNFDNFSPVGPPQLQGSHFAQRSAESLVPLPPQYPTPTPPRAYSRSPSNSQTYQPPSFATRTVSDPTASPYSSSRFASQYDPQIHTINMELESLGISDDHGPDDELPNYAQSQAEMNARRIAEASARARELETRWRNTRGW